MLMGRFPKSDCVTSRSLLTRIKKLGQSYARFGFHEQDARSNSRASVQGEPMPKLTDPLHVRGNIIKNRIAMLPMVTFSFKPEGENYYGSRHVDHYARAAKAGAGLIIVQSTSAVGVESGEGMWTAGSRNALRAIAQAARFHGATVMMQLSAGWDADWDINDWPVEEVLKRQGSLKGAAIMAARLGFHGVEYHFAHGYSLCRFMDASHNRRMDGFGGSLENRARIVTDGISDIRANTPENFILSARMGEYMPTSEDGIAMARHLETQGFDMLDVTFGMGAPEGPVPEGFDFSPITHSGYVIKQAVGVPVIGCNGIREPGKARLLVERGYADMAGVGRAMLADPRFADAALNGGPHFVCAACKRCFWFTDHTKCPARKQAEKAMAA